MSEPSFTCPRCSMTSYNRNDVQYGYCGNCHDYTGTTESAASVALRVMLRLADCRSTWSVAQSIALAHLVAAKIPLATLQEILSAMDTLAKEGTQ